MNHSIAAPLFDDEKSYYELLELTPDATLQEIKEAYQKIRNAYRPDSVALYSLFDQGQTGDLLKQVENAFQVLSHPERRREYDRHHGVLNVVSIDRVPPMESQEGDHLLIAPVTAFDSSQNYGRRKSDLSSDAQDLFDMTDEPQESFFGESPAPEAVRHVASPHRAVVPHQDPAPLKARAVGAQTFSNDPASLSQEIESETEWRGDFLKKIRETRSISIEELSNFTKVSKTYLLAIEAETFEKLPAPVFLRGFITQITRYLRLPTDPIVQAYMTRVQEFQKSKKK